MNFDILINDSMENATLDDPTLFEYRQQKICCFWDLNNNFKIDVDKFANYSLIIANSSWERSNVFNQCYQYIQEHSKNFIILTCRLDDHLKCPNLFYFPYYGYRLASSIKRSRKKINIEQNNKKYLVSCLNGSPRSHRVYNYLLLKDHRNFSDFYFTMHHDSQFESVLDLTHANLDVINHTQLSTEHVQQWLESRLQFANWENQNRNTSILPNQYNQMATDHDVYNPAYSDSYINLVTETVIDNHTFITEKTWKPVASGQLFLIIGYQGIISDLRKHGVDTFDDIINHDYYDNEPDWQLRIHKIHKVLNNLLEQDLEQLNQQTLDRRKSNAEKFINGKFFQSYLTDIISCINSLN